MRILNQDPVAAVSHGFRALPKSQSGSLSRRAGNHGFLLKSVARAPTSSRFSRSVAARRFSARSYGPLLKEMKPGYIAVPEPQVNAFVYQFPQVVFFCTMFVNSKQ